MCKNISIQNTNVTDKRKDGHCTRA